MRASYVIVDAERPWLGLFSSSSLDEIGAALGAQPPGPAYEVHAYSDRSWRPLRFDEQTAIDEATVRTHG